MESIKIENITYEEVVSICQKAMDNNNIINIRINDEEKVLSGEKEGSMFSFGERIQIKISSITKKDFEVEIKSESSFPLQIVDWGTNKQNVDLLLIEINKMTNK